MHIVSILLSDFCRTLGSLRFPHLIHNLGSADKELDLRGCGARVQLQPNLCQSILLFIMFRRATKSCRRAAREAVTNAQTILDAGIVDGGRAAGCIPSAQSKFLGCEQMKNKAHNTLFFGTRGEIPHHVERAPIVRRFQACSSTQTEAQPNHTIAVWRSDLRLDPHIVLPFSLEILLR